MATVPPGNAHQAEDIKKKIFDFARNYAFEKINNSLDKKMANKEQAKAAPAVANNNNNNHQQQSTSSQYTNHRRQFDSYDPDEESSGTKLLMADVSSMRYSNQPPDSCQAYIENERRYHNGRVNVERRFSRRLSTTMSNNSLSNRAGNYNAINSKTASRRLSGSTMATMDDRRNKMSQLTIDTIDDDEFETADEDDDYVTDDFSRQNDDDDEDYIYRDKQIKPPQFSRRNGISDKEAVVSK